MSDDQGLQLIVHVEGKTEQDLIMGLVEVLSQVKSGYHAGMDENETSSYNFSVDKT